MDKPHNIGAILIPGYGVSMKNIDQAITSEKSEHLNNIKEKKLLKLVALI